eukprot:TRINITY_DN1375_c0_g1_i2.p1 TRINITY_DN1375_c0_g1~~TRINITY_DN1375_c0_g1_i2.p1  ORF type:complete len:334 (+),score=108.65 TRINITY_DN1375_c0_g1_i2:79-1080(+)
MSELVGFGAATIAVFCFGSNFVPVKKIKTGDGMFFQLVMCIAIWIAGLIVYLVRGAPKFEPIAILGGVLWTSGNVCVVPIIRCIGMGMGLLIWGSANLIMGWASGNFGLFGIKAQGGVNYPVLNYLGLCICLSALIVNLFVKTDVADNQISLLDQSEMEQFQEKNQQDDSSFVDHLSPTQKRIVGGVLSVVSGLFYGVNFNPPQYLVDHGHSQDLIDYCFPHFCGIFLASVFYFLLYCVYMRSNPVLIPEAVLPGTLSGAMWAIAQISWFVANTYLPFVITFPIISSGPGMVGALWGIFVFKEVTGQRNLLIMSAAIFLTIVGIVLIALSKAL